MTLFEFISGHNVQTLLNPEEIITWLDSTPMPYGNNNQFEWVVLALSFESQAKWFSIKDVALWYSSLCSKIASGTYISAQSFGNNAVERKATVTLDSVRFISSLVNMGILNLVMQNLLIKLLARDFDSLLRLFRLFVADGTITEIEMFRLIIELNPTQKRWESLGLSQAPTITDLP